MGLYRASVPVQGCTLILPIPLLPYGPYGLYRASVPVQYSYTCTPPMCRTACTEPQCLYSTAIPLLPLWAGWARGPLRKISPSPRDSIPGPSSPQPVTIPTELPDPQKLTIIILQLTRPRVLVLRSCNSTPLYALYRARGRVSVT